jgi:hypothetical protein
MEKSCLLILSPHGMHTDYSERTAARGAVVAGHISKTQSPPASAVQWPTSISLSGWQSVYIFTMKNNRLKWGESKDPC